MKDENEIIEHLLSKYRNVIGKDFQLYRNHVYRVYLNCLAFDQSMKNEPKYAIASVFHDIGIWTHHTFDYLTPSMQQAKQYLMEANQHGWIDEITSMIYWHHKLTNYKGTNEEIIEIFRKADLIDVSFGVFPFGLKRIKFKYSMKTFPSFGFHRFLMRKALINCFRNPFRPLPMFKK